MSKRTLTLIILCVILSAFFLGCAQSAPEQSPSDAVIQINPLAEGASNDETTARLYYGFSDRRLLAGEARQIKVPINESIETSVLNELIREGPSAASINLTQVINPQTDVVATSAEGQYLAVTLSADFLKPVEATGSEQVATGDAEQTRRFLAVYSIVNTLVEQGSYARIRIMIDEDGTGTGRPITNAEAGLGGAGDAEPFARNGEVELTAMNTMRELLQGVERRDWNVVYDFIAHKNQYGQDKPSLEEFRNEMENARFTLSASQVVDDVLGADGFSEVVMVSYDLKPQGGEVQSFVNVPHRLVLENDVWKMTYNEFGRAFL